MEAEKLREQKIAKKAKVSKDQIPDASRSARRERAVRGWFDFL